LMLTYFVFLQNYHSLFRREMFYHFLLLIFVLIYLYIKTRIYIRFTKITFTNHMFLKNSISHLTFDRFTEIGREL